MRGTPVGGAALEEPNLTFFHQLTSLANLHGRNKRIFFFVPSVYFVTLRRLQSQQNFIAVGRALRDTNEPR